MRPTKLTKNILLFFSIIAVLLAVNSLVEQDNVYSSHNKTSKKTEHSAYTGIDIHTAVTEETTYNISIHYPEFKVSSLNEEIHKYINKSMQEFLAEVNRNKDNLKDNSASLHISFDLHPFAENMYAIVFTQESYITGANGFQNSKVFLADIQKERFIQQTEILNDNEETRDTIHQLLLNSIESSEKYSSYLLNELLEEWIEDERNKFANMYLTNNSVFFKFNEYEIAAGAAGSPEISIPLDKMSDLLTDEWKKTMDLENEGEEKSKSSKESEWEKIEDRTSDAKQVALTFDDGPHPINTAAILQLLDEYNAKATFFMLGNRVDFYPEAAQEIAAKGHEMGNHTWSHKDLTSLGETEIIQEIETTNEVILNATGEQPTVFRPPYGAVNDQVREIIGLPAVLWTIDTLDWKSHNPNEVLSIVKENISDGSVILMHDIHKSTVEAVELVLAFLEEEGYELVTVSELYSAD